MTNPRFQLERVLGCGGTAEVAAALRKVDKRQVAIKYPHPVTSDIDFSALARREYELIGPYRFPGLVRILEKPVSEERLLVLELCSGDTLDKIQPPDNPRISLSILSAIAAVLEFLRVKNIVHGDIKPHNFFLPSGWEQLSLDSLYFVKLSDFSLGKKSTEPDDARFGLGTVGYMAPETLAEQRATHQSDLFSFGVMAYQLLTGVHPFMAEDSDPLAVASRTREYNPPPPSSHRPDLPPELDVLIAGLLEKSEDRRIKTAWTVCEELQRLGSLYPTGRLLTPKYFFDGVLPYAEILSTYFELTDTDKQRMDDICAQRTDVLTLLASLNIRMGRMMFRDGRFVVTSSLCWPHSLRGRMLRAHWPASHRAKRQLLTSAVRTLPSLYGEQVKSDSPAIVRQAYEQFLKPATIKRLARRAQGNSSALSATFLALKTGDLQLAAASALRAASELAEANKPTQGIQVLTAVIEFASLSGRLPLIRLVLLKKIRMQRNAGMLHEGLATHALLLKTYADGPGDANLAHAYRLAGDICRMLQDSGRGLAYLKKARKLYASVGTLKHVCQMTYSIGNLYFGIPKIGRALHYYRRALSLAREISSPTDTMTILTNIGAAYNEISRHGRAARLLRHAKELSLQLGSKTDQARIANNLAVALHGTGDETSALEAAAHASAVNRELGNRKELLYSLETLAEIALPSGQFETATKYLEEGIQLAAEMNDRRFLASFQIYLGETLVRVGKIRHARAMLNEAHKELTQISDTFLMDSLHYVNCMLSFSIGDVATLVDEIDQVIKSSLSHGNKETAKRAIALRLRAADPGVWVEQYKKLCSERALAKENAILELCQVEFEHWNPAGSFEKSWSQQTEQLALRGSISAETAWMCGVMAHRLHVTQRDELALNFTNRAIQLSGSRNLPLEAVLSYSVMGEIKMKSGDFEKAYAAFKQAVRFSRQISSNLTKEDSEFFQKRPQVQRLAANIAALSQMLTKTGKS